MVKHIYFSSLLVFIDITVLLIHFHIMGFCMDLFPSDMVWALKSEGFQCCILQRLYWLFTLCGVNDKADGSDNYCVEGGRKIIDMRYLR